MLHEAERASRRLFVVKQNRFNPPVAAVKQANRTQEEAWKCFQRPTQLLLESE